MNFTINSIILWPRNTEHSPRCLSFDSEAVNIITGASRTGKSALIPIIDYCLGSDKCTIPVDIIRDACSWFGVLFDMENEQMLLCRREPGNKGSTDDMFLLRDKEISIPEHIEKNANVTSIKNMLNELFGMSFLELDPDAGVFRPSYRDFMAFLFQPQNIVANADVLFYKADTMEHADRFFFDQNGSAVELLTEMNAAIHNLSSSIQIYSSMDFRNNRSFADSDDLDAVSESLSELLDQIDDMLIWIEQHGSNTELVYCPKNTKEIVSRLYFNGEERTILTSATLTNATSGSLEEQYSYFISNTGFPAGDRGCLSEPKPSPYPYDEHAMIYYCDDLPHPTREHEAFIEKGVERLLEILSISNGKALVLFTAKTDMEEVYSILSQKSLPYKILMQQPGSSQDKVLNEFKEDTNSVLLGTGAYWEGISIEGKSLSNVIIFRLPFPVPDPIIEYKCSVAKDALMDVRVPEMIIKLKQGIGRLIRNFTDTGIVCIIDRRLRDEPPERYHDITWDSLPIKNRTSSLDELKRFYESLPSAKE